LRPMTSARLDSAVIVLVAWVLGASCGSAQQQINLAGKWSASETYEAPTNDPLYATWTIVQNGAEFDITSVRTSGGTRTGSGSISGAEIEFHLPCFAAKCGPCTYKFTGSVMGAADTANQMEGDVAFCAEDPSLTTHGKWSATRQGG